MAVAGQANYAAARMGVIGLMSAQQIEGPKNKVRVSKIAPDATTQMNENLLSPAVLDLMAPDLVTPRLLYIVSEEVLWRVILDVSGGAPARSCTGPRAFGLMVPTYSEGVMAAFDRNSSEDAQHVFESGGRQVMKFVGKTAAGRGVALSPGPQARRKSPKLPDRLSVEQQALMQGTRCPAAPLGVGACQRSQAHALRRSEDFCDLHNDATEMPESQIDRLIADAALSAGDRSR